MKGYLPFFSLTTHFAGNASTLGLPYSAAAS